MPQRTDGRTFGFGRIDTWLALAASVVLGFMMVFVFVGAVLRYLFNAPILGGNEVLELASVAAVMLAIPYCTVQNAHIRIDLLDRPLGETGRFLTEVLYRLLALPVFWFLVRAYVERMMDAMEYRDVTNLLNLPIWPFYGLVAVGMGLYGLILLGQMVLPAVRWWRAA